MMPILYIGGYSEMDGLELTCEFTFNKKEKRKTFKLQCRGVLLSVFFSNVLFLFLLKLSFTTPPFFLKKWTLRL